jgi:lipoprotein-anchoring transpeptidase ErfK/SrfK
VPRPTWPLIVVLTLAAGCAAPAPTARWVAPAAPAPVTLAVTPADRSRDVPTAAEVGWTVQGGRVTSVLLEPMSQTKGGTVRSGVPVRGDFRSDRTSWVPAGALAHNTSYTMTVTALSHDGGRTVTRTATFTTMPVPRRTTGTGLYLFDGHTYGVAMPVVVEFHPPVPPAARAGVERRLFVHSEPSQPGVWHWVGPGDQAYYRPRHHWRPGTVLTVRAALGGQPTGDGRYGDQDRSATVRIGRPVLLDVDNATKTLTVYAGYRPVRTIPVSLGKPATPSSSGHLVIMDKRKSTVFDTRGEDADGGYRVRIAHAQRLTWGGEFLHAAPWSVRDQGRRNVSHGCVNMSTANARWLYDLTLIGDPVLVRGTEVHIGNGNGWTAWDLPWAEYIRGSALPVPSELRTP